MKAWATILSHASGSTSQITDPGASRRRFPAHWKLGFLLRLTSAPRQIVLVQSLPDERLDDCLAANIELLGGSIQFLQHGCREVHVNALNRLNHAALTF